MIRLYFWKSLSNPGRGGSRGVDPFSDGGGGGGGAKERKIANFRRARAKSQYNTLRAERAAK